MQSLQSPVQRLGSSSLRFQITFQKSNRSWRFPNSQHCYVLPATPSSECAWRFDVARRNLPRPSSYEHRRHYHSRLNTRTGGGGIRKNGKYNHLYSNYINAKRHISAEAGSTQLDSDRTYFPSDGASSPQTPTSSFSRVPFTPTKSSTRQGTDGPLNNKYSSLPYLLTAPKKQLQKFVNWKRLKIDKIGMDLVHIGAEQKYQCKLQCQVDSLKGVLIEAVGTAWTTCDAENEAYHSLVRELHTRDIITKHLLNPPKKVRNERSQFDLKDIYDYASLFGSLPKVDFQNFDHPDDPSKIIYEATIKMPSPKIISFGAGLSINRAVLEATKSFKKQAEAYCLENGFSTDTSIIDDMSPTMSNAERFLDFFLLVNGKFTRFKLSSKRVRIGTFHMATSACLIDDKPISDPVFGDSKLRSNPLAKLAGVINLRSQYPEIWSQFVSETAQGKRVYLPPVGMSLDTESIFSMRSTLKQMKQLSFSEPSERKPLYLADYRTKGQAIIKDEGDTQAISKSLKENLLRFERDRKLASLRANTRSLPTWQHERKILEMIREHVYSIIIGTTGSGKSTQIPQMVLDDAIKAERGAKCNIMVTQPRRIAATSLARRVASERNETVGESVGYKVRFDGNLPSCKGSITYCTTGVLLSTLQHHGAEALNNLSHVFIDEVHERDIPTDLLLTTLKKAIWKLQAAGSPVPKVILMSATMDSNLFSNYLKNVSDTGALTPCPSISVQGRAYPVREHYLEDIMPALRASHQREELVPLLSEEGTSRFLAAENVQFANSSELTITPAGSMETPSICDPQAVGENNALSPPSEDLSLPLGLVVAVIAHLSKVSTDNGAILAFLPTLSSILTVEKMLYNHTHRDDFTDTNSFRIFKLHSTLDADQVSVFNPVPDGCRKIILATNIAETSITVPEVRYVVDTGKRNDHVYSQSNRIRNIACCWVDQSTSKQRRGRAGRVRSGHYYALFTRERYESLATNAVPGLVRSDLREVCLQIQADSNQASIRDFLSETPEPPATDRVTSALSDLQTLGALDSNEHVTPLGRLLARLPVHPICGKMIILGIIFRCLGPMLVVSGALDEKDIFYRATGQEGKEAIRIRSEYVGTSQSDQIGIVNAFNDVLRVFDEQGPIPAQYYCEERYISYSAFLRIRDFVIQTINLLHTAKLVPHPLKSGMFGGTALNVNSNQEPVIKALLLGGLYPHIAVRTSRSVNGWSTLHMSRVMVHYRSSNSEAKKAKSSASLLAFSTMYTTDADQQVMMFETTRVTPLMVCLFGGKLGGSNKTLSIDSKLPLKVATPSGISSSSQAARMVVELRKVLDRMLAALYEHFVNLAQKNRATSDDISFINSFDDGISEIVDMICDSVYLEQPCRLTMSKESKAASDDSALPQTQDISTGSDN